MAVWTAQSTRLKFSLGDYILMSVRFKALVFCGHFAELCGLDKPMTPPAPLPNGIDAVVIRSHPVNGALPRISKTGEFLRYVPMTYRRFCTDLQSGTFQDYLKKHSRKSRATLLRKVRRFADASGGVIDYREYRSASEMATFYRLARAVSRHSYQETLLGSGLPSHELFVQELERLAEQDLVRGYILSFEQRPIAYILCPALGDVLLYQYVGYDPAFARWSPGSVLQYCALETLFQQRRFRLFDFTEGEGQHKELFASHVTQCADVYYFKRSLGRHALVALHAGTLRCSRIIGQALACLHLKTSFKKWMRQRSGHLIAHGDARSA